MDLAKWRAEVLAKRRGLIPPPKIRVASWFKPRVYPLNTGPLARCYGPEITIYYLNKPISLEGLIFHEAAHSMRWWLGEIVYERRHFSRRGPRYLMEEAIADHVSLAFIGDPSVLREYDLSPLRRKYLHHSVRTTVAAFKEHGWPRFLLARARDLRPVVQSF